MFPAWDPTALRLVAPMKGITNLRSQPPHRGILRISPTNILLTLIHQFVLDDAFQQLDKFFPFLFCIRTRSFRPFPGTAEFRLFVTRGEQAVDVFFREEKTFMMDDATFFAQT